MKGSWAEGFVFQLGTPRLVVCLFRVLGCPSFKYGRMMMMMIMMMMMMMMIMISDNNNGDHDHENDEDGDAMTTHFSCNRYISLIFRVAIRDVPASNLAPEVCTEKPKVANMHTRP